MKSGKGKLMKTRGDRGRGSKTAGGMLRYTNGESEKAKEIWGEMLTVREGEIKVSERKKKESFSFVSE